MKYLKNSVGIFAVLLMMVSCDKSEELNAQSEIHGTWQLTETLIDNGNGESVWRDVENGYEYTFRSDNTFSSNKFDECQEGNYNIESDELSLDFNCESVTIGNQIIEGTLVERISFDGDELIINPTYVNCVEACGWKFEKV